MAKKGLISLPGFEGVDPSGGSFHIPEGDYGMKCTSCTQAVSKSSQNEMLVFTFTGVEGKSRNKKFWLYCALVPDAYWKLRQTLEALGIETPDDPSEFDPEDVVDVVVTGTVADNEYEGKTNSKLSYITALDGEKAEEDEDEPPAKAAKKAGNGKANKKAAIKYAASEVEDMDEDELEEIVAKHDLDVDLSTQKTKRRKANAVIAALQSEKLLEA